MPVWRNFFLGSEMTKGPWPVRALDIEQMKQTADEELRDMGIVLRDLDQPIGTLSGGQRQCVAIARAVYLCRRLRISMRSVSSVLTVSAANSCRRSSSPAGNAEESSPA